MLNRFSLPAIVWLIISTILLTIPGSAFPKENWLTQIQIDKWVHIVMFGLMTFLICWAIWKSGIEKRKWKQYFIVAAILCLCYGIIMEFVQDNFIPNRSFDVGDIIADGVGAALGLYISIKRFIKK